MAFAEHDNGTIVFTKQTESFVFAINNEFKPVTIPKPKPVYVKQLAKTGKIKWWDKDQDTMTNNLYPQVILNALAGCTAAGIALETVCVYTYGKGIGVFKRESADGKEKISPVIKPEHLTFFQQNKISEYCVKTITDYWTFGRYFTQLIANKGGDKIAGISATDAPFCRLGYQTPETGNIDNVYINGNWALFPKEDDCQVIPMVDTYNFEKQIKNGTKWIYSGYSYTPGTVYYHKHPWHAAVDTGVLDLAPEIPKIRKSRFKNAMFVKYHVQIEEQFWKDMLGEKKYATAKENPDEMRQIKNQVYAMIDQNLGGTANAYKSLFTGKITDRQSGNVMELVKISKVETDFGDNAAFDPDKMSNVSDIFLAFGLPMAIMNTVLNNAKSLGGGSDIREGIIAFQQRLKWHRDNILQALDFTMRYNKLLAPDEFLAFEDLIPTTLDVNPTGMQKTVAA